MIIMAYENGLSISFVSLAVILLLTASPDVGFCDLSGRVIYESSRKVGVGFFDSAKVIQKNEKVSPVIPFKPSVSPSEYRTNYRDRKQFQFLRITSPLNDASFPSNIAPPKICWEDNTDNIWLLKISLNQKDRPLKIVTDKKYWRPSPKTWARIKQVTLGGCVRLEVRGCYIKNGKRVGEVVYKDNSVFSISEYPADNMIVYRLVSPLFHTQKTPDIYSRHIDSFEVTPFLKGQGLYCTNCHFFPKPEDIQPDEQKLAIAVRDQLPSRKKSGQAKRILGIYDFSTKKGKTFNINSFFMGWSPDGKKIAVTAGETVSIRPCITLETQQFFVLVSDVVIVNVETNQMTPLKGASEPEYMENFPSWSPDGKNIVFCRAEESKGRALTDLKFGLFRVDFNDGRGGIAKPVEGASFNGRSNYAPRYSPDGKWIVFNQADSASLVEPTSDLWILATKKKSKPNKLECNVDYAMDSWHSWSSNSRWLLFASKRDDGVFARIYLTEIDKNGHASPPVKLPVRDDPMMCFNVPEFLNYNKKIDYKRVLMEITGPTVN
jgi:hypothetical protein